MKRNTMRNRAFTLVEIMIVVLIIGILMAIAVPNFVKARESSRKSTCVANLKQIDSAKEQLAMDNKLASGAATTMAALVGPTLYLKNTPTCPSSGTYTTGNVGTNPSCTVAGHVLP
jgi:prepilin-type N-terminal cleavage/methylation domain-containing protein